MNKDIINNNIQNESDDSDNQEDHLDQYPGVDIVEDFARQLDELCMNTADLHTNNDEDEENSFVPFGYEQLPQDEEGFGVLNSEDEDDNEEELINNDIKLEDTELSMSQNDQQQTENNLSTIKPLIIKLDSSEKISTETSDLIMNIMRNVNLPDHATPSWAKDIPESIWMPKMEE